VDLQKQIVRHEMERRVSEYFVLLYLDPIQIPSASYTQLNGVTAEGAFAIK